MSFRTTPGQNEPPEPIRLKHFKDVKSNYVGAEDTPERDEYEAELRAEIIDERIKEIRKNRNMAQ